MADLKSTLINGNLRVTDDANISGTVEATTIKKTGGTSSQFLKADGTVDSNTYATTGSLSGYLPLSGGTLTASSGDHPLTIKSATGSGYVLFQNSSGTQLGYIGVNSSKKPVFYDSSEHQLAYSADIPSVSNATITIKQTGLSDQTFTLNGSATTITLADNNSNTWRPINVNGSSAINDTSTTVNFTGGGTTNVSYSNGTITISSADSFTGYSSSNKLSASYISGLSTVATSGSYNDLSNKPTIPATNVIPAQTTANKVLLSTTTSGTAAWSSWSSAGFLKTNSSGVVSVDTNSYYLASNPNNYTSNTGTVTSVSAGTGLSISGTASTTPTVNIASGYKLPTTTEWGNKADASSLSNYLPLSGGCMEDNGSIWFNRTQWNSENYYGITYDSTNSGLLLRSQGNKFVLQGSGTYVGMFSLPTTLTANRTWTLPSSTGTIALTTSNVSSATSASALSYTTTAPTSANTSGLKVVVLSSEPAASDLKAGYLYIITT